MLTTNGQPSSTACQNLISPAATGCGSLATDLSSDYNMPGSQQAVIEYDQMLLVIYDGSYTTGKVAANAVTFSGGVQVLSESRSVSGQYATGSSLPGFGCPDQGGDGFGGYSRGSSSGCTDGGGEVSAINTGSSTCGPTTRTTFQSISTHTAEWGFQGDNSDGFDDHSCNCGCGNVYGSGGSSSQDVQGMSMAAFVRTREA